MPALTKLIPRSQAHLAPLAAIEHRDTWKRCYDADDEEPIASLKLCSIDPGQR